MDRVAIKKVQNGYEVVISDDMSIDQAMIDINDQLQDLIQQPNLATHLTVLTGNRVLNRNQEQRLHHLVDRFSIFQLDAIRADVLTLEQVKQLVIKRQIRTVARPIRSGQDLIFEQDVLLLGSLHTGAILRSYGNIYVLGEVSGILHAGYPDHKECVIAGDLSQAKQLRIADLVVVDQELKRQEANSFAYVNDIHQIEIDRLSRLQVAKPKLFQKLEEG